MAGPDHNQAPPTTNLVVEPKEQNAPDPSRSLQQKTRKNENTRRFRGKQRWSIKNQKKIFVPI